jgi:hypothetical protein
LRVARFIGPEVGERHVCVGYDGACGVGDGSEDVGGSQLADRCHWGEKKEKRQEEKRGLPYFGSGVVASAYQGKVLLRCVHGLCLLK